MIRILLVDHSLGHLNSVRGLLPDAESSNLKLDCVTSYREILNGFRSQAYDVCLIDSLMDNGIKLFAQARSLSFAPPIVLVISNGANTALQAMRAGVADCLVREELSVFQIERCVCFVVEQARNLLLQSQREGRHLALLENAREIVYTHDLKGNFNSMNRAGERVIGYAEAEILTMNVGQIVEPEYRGLFKKMIERTVDAQTQVAQEIEILTRDGRKLTAEANSHPIQHLGRTVEVQVVARYAAPIPDFEASCYMGTRDREFLLNDECKILSMPDMLGAISYPSFNH